jgi:hypothetical protein
MSTQNRHQRFRQLEGCQVNVALSDGSRLDDCQLVSAARRGTTTVWLYSGQDVFIALDQIIDLWEAAPLHRAA